jgi:glycosyltransferase involved in cell wall biosynthesis
MTVLAASSPTISICIPHWQVKGMMALCLRSIRKHSAHYNLEILVVDNGSRDESLDYLRSLNWIRLIERPDESFQNWPMNVFTAWDLGYREACGEYFVTMHSDVFVRHDRWLDPFLREMAVSENVAASGAWKLNLESPLYAFQKRVVGTAVAGIKRAFGRRNRSSWKEGHYPRDYCAMYRRDLLLKHNCTFCPGEESINGGYLIARQLWEQGYETRMIPLHEMAQRIVHVAHGTAAIAAEKPLNHKSAQLKVERRVRALFAEPWIEQLRQDNRLDAA